MPWLHKDISSNDIDYVEYVNTWFQRIEYYKTTTRWDEKHLSFEIWCVLYERLYGTLGPNHALAPGVARSSIVMIECMWNEDVLISP